MYHDLQEKTSSDTAHHLFQSSMRLVLNHVYQSAIFSNNNVLQVFIHLPCYAIAQLLSQLVLLVDLKNPIDFDISKTKVTVTMNSFVSIFS